MSLSACLALSLPSSAPSLSHSTLASRTSTLTSRFAASRRASPAKSQPSIARWRECVCSAYKVEIEHNGVTTTLEIDESETILSAALDNGMDLPFDCKLGVCMTCPAKIMRGTVDQSEGMLSDDVQEAGYALMCAAYPKSDCSIRVIPEDELLSLQLCA